MLEQVGHRKPREKDVFIAACLIACNFSVVVALCMLSLRTPAHAVDLPPLPEDKIITPDIAAPAAIQDLSDACDILDNLPPGEPPPWEFCLLLFGPNLESAWQQWKMDFCAAYDPHLACYVEELGQYDQSAYDALVAEYNAKVDNLASHNAIIRAKCDEINDLLDQWRQDAAAAAQERDDAKQQLMDLEAQLALCMSELQTLNESLARVEAELAALRAESLLAIAGATAVYLTCIAALATAGPLGFIIGLIACSIAYAVALIAIDAQYTPQFQEKAAERFLLQQDIEDKEAEIAALEAEIADAQNNLAQKQSELEGVLNSSEPCDTIAELDACIAEEQALAAPIVACLQDLSADLIAERNRLVAILDGLRETRNCLLQVQTNTMGQPVIGTFLAKRDAFWTDCSIPPPPGCPPAFANPATWGGEGGEIGTFRGSKLPPIVPDNPTLPPGLFQHVVEPCEHEDCEEVRQELIDQFQGAGC